ncbi:hypothetical protein GCM10022215_32600 [Nocardioides fonticola]|uniref:Uncharacterized protein n=1 Tax=Nocardioides fonticola TaxID=450363 RepID=A0ABP7XRU4_9ACTN
MAGRAGEWHLLGVDGDPLPGDVYEVSSEVTHYEQTASSIRAQVARLRQMASGTNELVGEFAPELRESAEKLADHLEQAEGRFDTVAEQLGRWRPVLDHGQVETGSLLRQAVEAQHQVETHQAPSTPVDPTDEQAASADRTRADRLREAQGELSRIVSRFRALMDDIDRTAEDVARRIDAASHDKLKDSWWDAHVRKFIHDHASFLKLIADVLTWVATALVIAVVLLSNPAGWMVLAAMALTAAAMVIHTVLAANGDGSWMDVAIDAFAVLTMGAGALFSSTARVALATREGMAAWKGASATARAALSESSGLAKGVAWLTRSNVVARNLRGAVAGLGRFDQVLNQELPGTASWLSRVTFGDKEGALLNQAIRGAQSRLGNGFLLGTARTLSEGARVTFVSGSVVDVTAKGLNSAFPNPLNDWKPLKPAVPAWDSWLEEHTVHGRAVFR